MSAEKKLIETQAEKLLKSLRSTAGARFNASRRLETHDKTLTRLTAFSSAYVIIITVLPYFLKLSTEVVDLYNFFTVILSIIILTASLLQYSSNNVVNAEQFHRSGLEINELYRSLLLEGDCPTKEVLSDFSSQYSTILQKYSINHEEIDYLKYQLGRPEEHPWLNITRKICIYAQIERYKLTPNIFLLVITSIVVWLVWRGALPQISKW